MDRISNKAFTLVTMLFYSSVVIYLSCHHALWRDEVQPMSAVVASTSLFDLYGRMHNFGHPDLLVSLLYFFYHVLPYYFVLKIVNISACIIAAYIFLVFAPFSRIQKLLFIFGFFPLYLYPVFNRDYSLILLFLFCFASLYQKRHEKMIPVGLVLLLLANAHAYALIITIAITFALAVEFLFSPEAILKRKSHGKEFLIGFALILVGIIFSIVQTVPDHTSIYYQPHSIGLGKIFKSLIQSVVKPGEIFPTVFGVSSALFSTIIVFFVYFYLLPKPYLFILFLSADIGLGLFFHLIYESTEIRYQGSFYLLLVTVLWIDQYVIENNLWKGPLANLRKEVVRHKDTFFTLLLIIQICLAYPAVKEEALNDYSSSKAFGKLVQQNELFKQAIIIGDPDNNLEAIPYYANNPIYLLREDRFAKYRQLTTINRQEMSLSELLDVSRKLKAKMGKPVLILLGYKLSPDGPFKIISSHHNKVFTYSKDSWTDLTAHTTLVGSFHKAICDENYDVYFLK